jgi:hypothetical protein
MIAPVRVIGLGNTRGASRAACNRGVDALCDNAGGVRSHDQTEAR